MVKDVHRPGMSAGAGGPWFDEVGQRYLFPPPLMHRICVGDRYLLARSRVMMEILAILCRIAASDLTVLLEGETGTGKDLIAMALHILSSRSRGPFITVNCGGLTDTINASELNGHVQGAFTSATAKQRGLLPAADGGTLFLNEVGEATPNLQIKLLDFVQYRRTRSVGDETSRIVDTRIVAATNHDLDHRTREGFFRRDLFYRLKVVRIKVPPLRDRKEDIPILAQEFFDASCRDLKKTLLPLSSEVVDLLIHHPWPGNVRELENGLVNLVATASTDSILPSQVEDYLRAPDRVQVSARGILSGHKAMEEAEILETLRACHGNKSEAAARLGLNRSTLHRKLKRMGKDAPVVALAKM